MFLHARPGCPALVGQGNVSNIQEIHIVKICLKLVKSQPSNLTSNLFNSAGSQSNLCLRKGVSLLPLTLQRVVGSLVITLVFAISHQKNKIPPSNSNMIKALGKPARVSREENNPLPHILASQRGRAVL